MKKQALKRQILNDLCSREKYMIPLTSAIWNTAEKCLDSIKEDYQGNEYLIVGKNAKYGSAKIVYLNDTPKDN